MKMYIAELLTKSKNKMAKIQSYNVIHAKQCGTELPDSYRIPTHFAQDELSSGDIVNIAGIFYKRCPRDFYYVCLIDPRHGKECGMGLNRFSDSVPIEFRLKMAEMTYEDLLKKTFVVKEVFDREITSPFGAKRTVKQYKFELAD